MIVMEIRVKFLSRKMLHRLLVVFQQHKVNIIKSRTYLKDESFKKKAQNSSLTTQKNQCNVNKPQANIENQIFQ